MPAAKYIVELTAEEREQLLAIIRRGKTGARKITRSRILLKADERLTDEQIASACSEKLWTSEAKQLPPALGFKQVVASRWR